MKYIIVSNLGDDSAALLEWAVTKKLANVSLVYVLTGWANDAWTARIPKFQNFCENNNIPIIGLEPKINFAKAVESKNEFPSAKFQWCAGMLKGLPIIDYLDMVDPFGTVKVILPIFRFKSKDYSNTLEVIEDSDYFGGRTVWHPLINFDEDKRDLLIKESSIKLFESVKIRECMPCVHSTSSEILKLSKKDVNRVKNIENSINKSYFEFPIEKLQKKLNEKIKQKQEVIESNNSKSSPNLEFTMGCGSFYGCGS